MARGVGDMYIIVIGWDIYIAGGSFSTLGRTTKAILSTVWTSLHSVTQPVGVEHLSKGNEATGGMVIHSL
jgi:hypothetical protein